MSNRTYRIVRKAVKILIARNSKKPSVYGSRLYNAGYRQAIMDVLLYTKKLELKEKATWPHTSVTPEQDVPSTTSTV